MGCLEPGCNEDSVFCKYGGHVAHTAFRWFAGVNAVAAQSGEARRRFGALGFHRRILGAVFFRLYDLQGRQLAQRQVAVGEARFELPLSGFGAGILLCVLEDQQGRVFGAGEGGCFGEVIYWVAFRIFEILALSRHADHSLCGIAFVRSITVGF